MSTGVFRRILVPVASEPDARATATAVRPILTGDGGTGIFAYVVEKAGGAPDKASVEQRETYAQKLFDGVHAVLEGQDLSYETDVLYGTDIGEAIIEGAHAHQADGIAFTPRGGSRWLKLLTGDVTETLVSSSDLPVIVLPEADSASGTKPPR